MPPFDKKFQKGSSDPGGAIHTTIKVHGMVKWESVGPFIGATPIGRV